MICPECGATFAPHNGRQAFCTTAHKAAFHHLMAHRGQMLLPLALSWRRGKHGAHRELAPWAMAQMCALLDKWNGADKAAGRRPDLVAEGKRLLQWVAADSDTR